MAERLTVEQLGAIRKRAEAATKGNWHKAILKYDPRTFTVGAFNGTVSVVGDVNNENDADFIAHAREDIPALLNEIDRLKEDMREISEIVSGFYGVQNGLRMRLPSNLFPIAGELQVIHKISIENSV